MTGSIARVTRNAAWVLGVLWLIATPLAAQRPAGDTVPPHRPLSLEQALQLSGPASEAVGIARAAVLRARGQQIQARSEFFPQITGTASYTRTLKSQFSTGSISSDTTSAPASCPAFLPDPLLPISDRVDSLENAVQCLSNANPFAAALGNLPFGRKNQYRFGFSASQTLFAGGRIVAQTHASGAQRRSAEIGLTTAEAQLTLDITKAYYDAVLGDQLLAIGQATLDETDTTLAQTRLARQVGNQPEFELLRAQVTRDNQRPVVIQRRTQRDIAHLRLKQLLNLSPDDSLELTTDLGDSSLASVPALAALIAAPTDTATEARAPVRQATEGVRAQENLLTAARAERFPALSLSTQFARIGYPDRGLPGWNDFVSDWTVSLGFQVPIFTGGRLRGKNLVARADLDEARLRLRQVAELAQLDTRSSLSGLRAAEATWEASQGTVEQARKAYSIAEIRYREGISTQTELSDSRIQLQQAEANRAVAARDLQVARVRMAWSADLPLEASVVASGTQGQQQQTQTGRTSSTTASSQTVQPGSPTQ